MKITKITKEYYEVDGEKVYFLEPLEKVISIKELQKIMDTAEKTMKTISKKDLMEFLREEKKASIANKQYSKESPVNKAYYEGMVLAQNRTIEFIKKMLRNYEI